MPRSVVTFDPFLRAVHRRQVILRILEGAGLGLLVGCAVSTALVAISLWRGGEDGRSLAVVSLSVGTVVGAIAGVLGRPSKLSSATEADRQLGTDDLFSTAFTLWSDDGSKVIDPWAQTVLALAAETSRNHAPREVVLRRLGVRAWGGILLAVGFVAVLATLSQGSREAVAARTVDAETALGQKAEHRAGHEPIVELTDATVPTPVQHRQESSPDEHRAGKTAQESSPQASPGESDARATGEQPNLSGPKDASSGAGQSQTPSAKRGSTTPGKPDVAEANKTESSVPSDLLHPGGGVGRSAVAPNHSVNDATAGMVSEPGPNSARVPPPWTSASWSQTVQSAEQQLRSGHVPDDARDLVRGYFDPSAGAP